MADAQSTPAQPAAPVVISSSCNEFDIAAGIASPTGAFGNDYSVGPLVRLSVYRRDPQRHAGARVDAELFTLPSRVATVNGVKPLNVKAGSVMANALIGPPAIKRSMPYALLGAGVQIMHDLGGETDPGALIGLRDGVGVRGPVGKIRGSGDVAYHAVFSPYGNGRGSFGGYFPISIGMRFQVIPTAPSSTAP